MAERDINVAGNEACRIFYLRGDHTRMVAQRFSMFFRGCKQPNLSSFVISAAKLRVICDLSKGFEIYKF